MRCADGPGREHLPEGALLQAVEPQLVHHGGGLQRLRGGVRLQGGRAGELRGVAAERVQGAPVERAQGLREGVLLVGGRAAGDARSQEAAARGEVSAHLTAQVWSEGGDRAAGRRRERSLKKCTQCLVKGGEAVNRRAQDLLSKKHDQNS